MSALTHPRSRRRWIRIVRNRDGSAAIEFAIVAPVFLAILMSTFEVGWFFFANSQVDAAVLDASRLVRTGTPQQTGIDKDEFFDIVCPKVSFLGPCQSRLTVEVKNYPSFTDLANDTAGAVCRDDDPTIINAIPYEPGTEQSIVRVRLCFLYDTINPAVGVNLAESANGRRALVSTYVFRNEPYLRNQQQTP